MATIPANASLDDIEVELMLVDVMLESLDPEADDYVERKRELEAQQQDLEIRKNSLQPASEYQPQTPVLQNGTPSLYTHGSGRSIDLPTRPAIGNSYAQTSPFTNRSTYGDRTIFSPGGSHTRPGINAAGPAPSFPNACIPSKKRPHAASITWQGDNDQFARKSRCISGSPASTASSLVSVDSLEQDENAFAQRSGLNLSANRSGIRKRWEEQQREQEQIIKREWEDAQLARDLARQSQLMPNQPSRSTTQSYFGPGGQVQRPIRPNIQPAPSPYMPNPAPSQYLKTENTPSSVNPQWSNILSKVEPVENGTPWAPGQSQVRRAPGQKQDSDDELLEISAADFTPKVKHDRPGAGSNHPPHLPAPMRPLPAPYGFYNAGSHAGIHYPTTVGGIGGSSVYGVPPNLPPQQPPGYYCFAGQSNRIQQGPAWQEASRKGMPQSQPTADIMHTMSNLPPIEGMNWPTEPLDLNDYSSSEEYSGAAPGLNDDLQARGLGYLLNDPTKTKEEIEALLSNIRPDEDLPPEMRLNTPDAMKTPLMEHQKMGLTWLKAQEEGSNKGGILADDMGLGKTIQALALMVSRPSEDPARKTNLIIAPVSLMRQWEREIKDKVKDRYRLTTFIYHGSKVAKASFAQLSTYDVVLTTFGTLGAEWKRKVGWLKKKEENRNLGPDPKGYPLLDDSSRWYRIIIDEAQNIKNKSTRSATAALQLQSIYRLCMTGTPMMNGVHELFSLVRFLRIPPYNDLTRFNRAFILPIRGRSEGPKEKAMRALQVLLKAILLRRTKQSKIDGNPILNLPERTTEVKHAVFSPDENAFYKHLETKSQLTVNKYLKAGTVGRNYSNILVLLLRLRQACCHPHLIKGHGIQEDGSVPTEEMEALVGKLKEGAIKMIMDANGAFECPVCYDAVENPTIFFPCGHDVCSECFCRMTDPAQAMANGEVEGAAAKCPECRSKLDPQKVFKYTIFKKIHMPEEYEKEQQRLSNGSEDEESETEIESAEDKSDDDADSQGDLRDFIVADGVDEDEVETEDEVENGDEEKEQVKNEDVNIGNCSKRALEQSIKKDKRRKGKAKAKSEGKKPAKTLAELKKEGMRNVAAKRRYLRRLRQDWVTSSKIEKTIEILRDIQAHDKHEKTIIFSQFTSLLDLLEVPIDDQGWAFRRYDGSMSSNLRNDAVLDFMDKPDVKIMLVSLKAGNAGLNLTKASQVIILDPFWNPYIEEQAIDRAHRIGQQRPVRVHRVLVEGTVEDRILELQEKKRQVISTALDEKTSKSLSRLGTRELRYLFGLSSSLES